MSGGKACDKAKVHIHIPVGRLSGEQPVIFAGQQGMRMEKVSEKAHKGGETEKKEDMRSCKISFFIFHFWPEAPEKEQNQTDCGNCGCNMGSQCKIKEKGKQYGQPGKEQGAGTASEEQSGEKICGR